MPTYEGLPRFWNDFEALNPMQQALVRRARDEFVGVLLRCEAEGCRDRPKFPAHLGVKPVRGFRGTILEFAWAGDGRCTWEHGTPREFGTFHIVWRRCGSHEIYKEP